MDMRRALEDDRAGPLASGHSSGEGDGRCSSLSCRPATPSVRRSGFLGWSKLGAHGTEVE